MTFQNPTMCGPCTGTGIQDLSDFQNVQTLFKTIRAKESLVPGLRRGSEKTIRWATPAHPAGTDLCIVYLHGFSADRQETAPLCDHLAAALGANLFYTRLTGHGMEKHHLVQARADDWIRDALEAARIGAQLGERLVLVGTSTGATLALWIALNAAHMEKLAAMILLSPNFKPRNPAAFLFLHPAGMRVAKKILGPERRIQPVNAAHRKHWHTAYPVEAILPLMDLVRRTRRLDLGRIRVPTFMTYDDHDTVVSVRALKRRFRRIGSPVKKRLAFNGTSDPYHHIPAGAILSPATVDPLLKELLDFLKTVI